MNIYDISDWATSTAYAKNAIVKNGSYYYYAVRAHTSGTFATDLANGLWGGIGYDNSETKPYFFWTPSYEFTNNNQPKVKTIQFGDGYVQDIPDGINNILINAEYMFNNRDLNETTAILHFLETRKGSESFIFIPPAPRNKIKRFKCKQWQDKQSFYGNYSISARFEEVVV